MVAGELVLKAAIGYNGNITDGLAVRSKDESVIYALGSTIVIRKINSLGSLSFLHGHTSNVSCFALSSSARYLATGQVAHLAFAAEIILWDLSSCSQLHRWEIHKGKVETLDFSSDEKYLVSIGGQDDNALILWDVHQGTAMCGSSTDGSLAPCIKFLNATNKTFVTSSCGSLRFWDYDKENNKVMATEVNLGLLRRTITCFCVDSTDHYIYCGTTSGDILQVSVHTRLFYRFGPNKNPIHGGITSIVELDKEKLLVGAGDGTIRLLTISDPHSNSKPLKPIRELASVQLTSPCSGQMSPTRVSSMSTESKTMEQSTFLVGTNQCDMYRVKYTRRDCHLTSELIQTSHSSPVRDIAFPFNCNDIFATCGLGDIRLWHLKTSREILRMVVPNSQCHCLCFARDGSSIFSGWSDSTIRVFRPESGNLQCKRPDAHHNAVSALVSTKDANCVISGGDDGTVRVWRLIDNRIELLASMKEHKAAVTAIAINEVVPDECASCSEDGSVVIWDLKSFLRRNSFFANTCFCTVQYHPDGCQLITGGTDRKLTYWDPFDGQSIRIVDGSESEPINDVTIDRDGETFISGGGDCILKQWHYDEGIVHYTGKAHSGSISKIKISPDQSSIISVGTEGGIYIWSRPNVLHSLSI